MMTSSHLIEPSLLDGCRHDRLAASAKRESQELDGGGGPSGTGPVGV